MYDIKTYETPLDDVCESALKHYLKLSGEACSFHSLIPDAIEFYRKNHLTERVIKLSQKEKLKALRCLGLMPPEPSDSLIGSVKK